ncbi:MAG TPA: ATP-binding protein [Baekduia sp.]|nr:ATP-binding protein [Baekduia sp.]
MTPAILTRVELRHDEGVVVARQRGRDVAGLLGFDRQEQTRIATAVSELARNAHRYAHGGRVTFSYGQRTLVIEVADDGPGIADADEVLAGRYRSATGLGRGLVGVRLLMDDFDLATDPARGTRVRIGKRLPADAAEPDVRGVRDELSRRLANPYDEVTRQNEELLQALGEVRARQEELVALNRELEDTNRGVVALYAELDDRAERLRDADERKSRFLADMSHELRTPLNSIIALTELLLDGEAALEGEQLTQVSFIRRMAEDQLKLVGDLLDIAKIEAGKLEVERSDLSAAELFAALRAQLRPLVAGRDVELRLDAEPDLPLLHTDEDKLVQILRNLISNALKFTARGEVAVTAERDGDVVAFRVRDTGVGIAPDDLERIFEEFVQVGGVQQRRTRGTGLGLPLSRKLAELLGGRIEVESELGRGTTFTVRLPIAGEAAVAPDAPVDAAGSVLVVDDDAASRYVVRTHLRDSAWSVQEVDSGEAALAACERGLPVAVVLDLSMPDLDGVEVLQRLRSRHDAAALPVIVHTSRLLDRASREALEAQGAHVLDKSETSRTSLLEALARATATGSPPSGR